MAELAPLIAVVGCDGSGKSTLAADLLAHLRERGPAEAAYLGLGAGALGKRIKAWPLIGPLAERHLVKKADRARDSKDKIPGAGTALVLYALSLRRKRRFERVLRMRREGITVVTDRYPQIDVPGFYDGPGLSAARAEGWLVRTLAARERASYAKMVETLPSLVIRLNIDADTALARKPEHARALIERKVEATPKLRFNGARIVDLDAREPYAAVLEKALGATRAVLG